MNLLEKWCISFFYVFFFKIKFRETTSRFLSFALSSTTIIHTIFTFVSLSLHKALGSLYYIRYIKCVFFFNGSR